MEIRQSDLALKQRDFIKKSGNVAGQKKISRFLEEIVKNPTEASGTRNN